MYSKAPILKDPKLQKEFDENGFVKVNLLTDTEADELYDFFMAHSREHDAIPGKYQSTTHTNDPNLIRKVDSYLKEKLKSKLPFYFQNYETMMATYITKQPGEGSDTGMHQDPTFVDEDRYVSGNIWLALHDIGHDNGNMFFLKGTHRMVPTLRVTPACPTAFDEVRDIMHDYVTEVPVRKGEAIFINHAVVHGATNNLSNAPRVAVTMAIRSVGSDWVFHYMAPDVTPPIIEKYEVALDTFIHLKKDGFPDMGKQIGTVEWDFPTIGREHFIKKMKKNNNISPLRTIFRRWGVLAE
jgi:hypothetical protein